MCFDRAHLCVLASERAHYMSNAFVPGQTVRLKSGGPLMTVSAVNDGEVTCEWFDENGVAMVRVFKAAVLKPAAGGSGAGARRTGTRGRDGQPGSSIWGGIGGRGGKAGGGPGGGGGGGGGAGMGGGRGGAGGRGGDSL